MGFTVFQIDEKPQRKGEPMSNGLEDMMARVGARIAHVRGQLNLTQQALSEKMGFKDRQTLQQIEAGRRNLSVEELVRLIEVTQKDLDFFTDPFRMVGEAQFSFRAQGAGLDGLAEFEEKAGSWIAFWREQGRKQKVSKSPLRPSLALNLKSSYEDAQQAGEALCAELELGDVPAERLVEAAQDKLGLLLLHVTMPAGISGAACQAAGADAVLVNRSEPEGRRNFDLAHELFHVLTWDALPPRRVDRSESKGYKDKHTEALADNFAGGLLMPRALLEPLWKVRVQNEVPLQDWIAVTAARFRVSGSAMKYRLLNMDWIGKPDLLEINDAALARPPGPSMAAFSRTFIERAGRAIKRGDVSVSRLIQLLELTGRGGLKDLFREHGLPIPEGV